MRGGDGMVLVHHSAICTNDVTESLRFWCEGLGFERIMDGEFEGDWQHLFGAPSGSLRSLFLGDPANADAGVVELVDFGAASPDEETDPPVAPVRGFFLLSMLVDLDVVLARLGRLGLDAGKREISAYGVRMAVVRDPNGVLVELIDTASPVGEDDTPGHGGG